MKSLFLLVTLILIASCGQKAETVDAKLSFVLGGIAAPVKEGMLWGKNLSNNTSFGQRIEFGVPFEKELEHGKWNFWVMTWDNANLKGSTLCDFKEVQISSGSATVDIPFTIRNQKCSNNFGSSYSNSNIVRFPKVSLQNCAKISGADCNLLGYFSSYRISFLNFDGTKNSNGIKSACYNKNDDVDVNVPVGHVNSPFQTRIEAFSGVDCIETHGVYAYNFSKGLIENNTRVEKELSTSSSLNLLLVSTFNDFCKGSRLSSPTAGGSGTADSLHLFCSYDQFIRFMATNSTSFYRFADSVTYCREGYIIDFVNGVEMCTIAPFSFTVDLTMAGVYELPLSDSTSMRSKYNFSIDWGDGTQETVVSPSTSYIAHTYANPGEYNVVIRGKFPAFNGNGGGASLKPLIKEVYQLGDVGWEDLSYAFSAASSLVYFNNSSATSTSNVTNMSFMFAQAGLIGNLDLVSFNTSNVTNMESMFYGTMSLANINVSSFDTSKVTNMASMFYYLGNITSLDISNFNTSSVTDMSLMFASSPYIAKINVGNIDISSVSSSTDIFYGLSTSLYCNQGTSGMYGFGVFFGQDCKDPAQY